MKLTSYTLFIIFSLVSCAEMNPLPTSKEGVEDTPSPTRPSENTPGEKTPPVQINGSLNSTPESIGNIGVIRKNETAKVSINSNIDDFDPELSSLFLVTGDQNCTSKLRDLNWDNAHQDIDVPVDNLEPGTYSVCALYDSDSIDDATVLTSFYVAPIRRKPSTFSVNKNQIDQGQDFNLTFSAQEVSNAHEVKFYLRSNTEPCQDGTEIGQAVYDNSTSFPLSLNSRSLCITPGSYHIC